MFIIYVFNFIFLTSPLLFSLIDNVQEVSYNINRSLILVTACLIIINTRERYRNESYGLQVVYTNHSTCLAMLCLNVSINEIYNKNE